MCLKFPLGDVSKFSVAIDKRSKCVIVLHKEENKLGPTYVEDL